VADPEATAERDGALELPRGEGGVLHALEEVVHHLGGAGVELVAVRPDRAE
jgi:hypothetical protein